MDLIYKREHTLFTISAILSLLIWGALLLGTVGVLLIYLVCAYLFYLFVQSAFISHIKGTGVKLSPQQFPDLFERLQACCVSLPRFFGKKTGMIFHLCPNRKLMAVNNLGAIEFVILRFSLWQYRHQDANLGALFPPRSQ